MRSKKNVIIGVIIIVLMAVILALAITINKSRKNARNNMEMIKNNYTLLTSRVSKYNEIRSEYNDKSSVLLIDSYQDKHEDFIKLFDEYNNVIHDIDNYITNINIRCNSIYNDNEVNKICHTYARVYEKLVNLYVGDVDNYNKFITDYNEYTNSDLELVTKVHNDYIDYNNDLIYEGRDSSEGNQN